MNSTLNQKWLLIADMVHQNLCTSRERNPLLTMILTFHFALWFIATFRYFRFCIVVYSNFPNFRFWLRFIEFVRTYPAAADLGTLTQISIAYALRAGRV